MHTHVGNYYTQLALDTNQNLLWIRSANNSDSFGSWVYMINSSNIGSQSVSYANSAGNADTVNGYREYYFLRYRGATVADGEGTLWSQIGIKQYENALPDGLTSSGSYTFGSVITFAGADHRLEFWSNHHSSAGNYGIAYRTGWDDDKRPWTRLIDSNNIGSQSVSYATSAGNADTVDGYHYDNLPYLSNSGGSLWGNITFNGGHAINHLYTIYCAGSDTNHVLYLGYNGKDYVTWHEYGNDWRFYYGGSTAERDGYLSVMLGSTNYFESNVGIGTTSPSYKLHVVGDIYATGDIMSQSALTVTSGNDNKIILDNTDSETYWSLISFRDHGSEYGYLGTRGSTDLVWNGNVVIHSGNITSQYVSHADSAGSVDWSNVSGRPSSMPASDVYSWAKASSKPSYSWSEITDKPTIPDTGKMNYLTSNADIYPQYGVNVLVKMSTTNGYINLPSLSQSQSYTGTSGSQKFAYIIRLACHTSGSAFTMYGYRGTSATSQYPHVRSGNTADRTTGVAFSAGDTDTYMLTYDGSVYEAYRLCYTE